MTPRGGKRAGAGRPVTNKDRGRLVRYTVRLYPDQIEKLRSIGDAGDTIRQLVDALKK